MYPSALHATLRGLTICLFARTAVVLGKATAMDRVALLARVKAKLRERQHERAYTWAMVD